MVHGTDVRAGAGSTLEYRMGCPTAWSNALMGSISTSWTVRIFSTPNRASRKRNSLPGAGRSGPCPTFRRKPRSRLCSRSLEKCFATSLKPNHAGWNYARQGYRAEDLGKAAIWALEHLPEKPAWRHCPISWRVRIRGSFAKSCAKPQNGSRAEKPWPTRCPLAFIRLLSRGDARDRHGQAAWREDKPLLPG